MKFTPIALIALLFTFTLHAEPLIGLTYNGANQLITFDSNNPETTTVLSVTGTSDMLVGLDFWNNILYGVSSSGNLYSLSSSTGQATLIKMSSGLKTPAFMPALTSKAP